MPMNRKNYLFRESDSFEKKRRKLLQDVVDYIDTEILKKGFLRDFAELFDEITLNMMLDEEDFYARFLSKMTVKTDFVLQWPVTSVPVNENIMLYVNPISFLYLNRKEMEAMIKHEIFHLLLNHHSREKELRRKYSAAAVNIALDITVNQFISNIPAFSLKLSSVNKALNLDLDINESLEKYTEKIEKALVYDKSLINSIKEEHSFDYNNVHDKWSGGNDLKDDISKEKFASTLEYAMKGSVPSEIEKLFPDTASGVINWKREIRDAVRVMPSQKKKTMARRNRRQPERLDLRGELRKYSPEIIVAVDISASIDNEDIKSFLTEMLPLMREMRKGIRVIECDDRIRRDYVINEIKDIKDIPERKGGTRFSPVFELLREENKRDALLVYFTDGEGELKLDVRPVNSVIWVVTGNSLSVEQAFGKVLYIKKETEKLDRAIGLQTMRELLHEWAR